MLEEGEKEHGRTTSQSCATGGRKQAHAAKCAFSKSGARNRAPLAPEGTPPGYDAFSVMSFLESACDEEGRKKFAVLETKRGPAREPDRNYRELQEAIEYMKSEAEQAVDDHGVQAKIDERGLG